MRIYQIKVKVIQSLSKHLSSNHLNNQWYVAVQMFTLVDSMIVICNVSECCTA
jgi:hypothetical protein